jgi:hypothetical protein
MQKLLLRVSSALNRAELIAKTDKFCIVEVHKNGKERAVLRTEDLAKYDVNVCVFQSKLEEMKNLSFLCFFRLYPLTSN